MEDQESKFLHGFNLMPQFGPARLISLYKNFGNFQKAFQASATELIKNGFDEKLVNIFLDHRTKINLELELEKLNNHNIKILSFLDDQYPRLLKEISKAPPILYYRGTRPLADELCVAVVGTRKINTYGRTVTVDLTEPLSQSGVTVVSGLAFGVDALAHQTAVKNQARTIAVLGGGLDDASLYPRHHVYLAAQILDTGGTLISEYPIGTPNFKQNFVARNRIISGLSVATIIVECDLKSGTLITAKYALEQNRQVYAVPGPIYTSQSQGPNNLLKMGARPITSANDVFNDLNLTNIKQEQQAQNNFADTQEEAILLKIISHEPILIDSIIKLSGLDAATITSTLTFLEMKGRIRNLGGQQYVLGR